MASAGREPEHNLQQQQQQQQQQQMLDEPAAADGTRQPSSKEAIHLAGQ
jgi:hypothetical protein